jgi:hypothetical protein
MLYDVIKPQGDPSFGVLASSNFSQGGSGSGSQGGSGSGVTYVERSRRPAPSELELPFILSVKQEESGWKYNVRPGSITNGTNGGPFEISGLDEFTAFNGEKFIVAEATVTSSPFEIDNVGFEIKAVVEEDTNEVKFDDDDNQEKLRLLIGKLVVVPNSDPVAYTPLQASFTSYKTIVSLQNGVPVYVLQAAPSHQSILVLPEP